MASVQVYRSLARVRIGAKFLSLPFMIQDIPVYSERPIPGSLEFTKDGHRLAFITKKIAYIMTLVVESTGLNGSIASIACPEEKAWQGLGWSLHSNSIGNAFLSLLTESFELFNYVQTIPTSLGGDKRSDSWVPYSIYKNVSCFNWISLDGANALLLCKNDENIIEVHYTDCLGNTPSQTIKTPFKARFSKSIKSVDMDSDILCILNESADKIMIMSLKKDQIDITCVLNIPQGPLPFLPFNLMDIIGIGNKLLISLARSHQLDILLVDGTSIQKSKQVYAEYCSPIVSLLLSKPVNIDLDSETLPLNLYYAIMKGTATYTYKTDINLNSTDFSISDRVSSDTFGLSSQDMQRNTCFDFAKFHYIDDFKSTEYLAVLIGPYISLDLSTFNRNMYHICFSDREVKSINAETDKIEFRYNSMLRLSSLSDINKKEKICIEMQLFSMLAQRWRKRKELSLPEFVFIILFSADRMSIEECQEIYHTRLSMVDRKKISETKIQDLFKSCLHLEKSLESYTSETRPWYDNHYSKSIIGPFLQDTIPCPVCVENHLDVSSLFFGKCIDCDLVWPRSLGGNFPLISGPEIPVASGQASDLVWIMCNNCHWTYLLNEKVHNCFFCGSNQSNQLPIT
jgi:hypothetical protein